MRTFLLPTPRANTWLNPLDGKKITIEPMQVNSQDELVELIADMNNMFLLQNLRNQQ